jgi:hypothetical protein
LRFLDIFFLLLFEQHGGEGGDMEYRLIDASPSVTGEDTRGDIALYLGQLSRGVESEGKKGVEAKGNSD